MSTSTVHYRLSPQQQDELRVNKVMRIALPYPDDCIPGAYRDRGGLGAHDEQALAAWIEDHLHAEQSRLLAASVQEVPVNPLVHSGSGLGRVLGVISNPGMDRASWLVRIVCVVADLCHQSLTLNESERRTLRKDHPIQFPAEVEFVRRP